MKTADGEKKIVSDSSWRTQLASCWTPGEHRRDYLRACRKFSMCEVSCRLELPRLQGFNLDSREGVESHPASPLILSGDLSDMMAYCPFGPNII